MKQQTKFKQTEIGMIPEDWEVKRIGDFLDIKHGFAFKGEFFSDKETDNILLTPGNFNIGGGFKSDKLKFTAEELPKDYVLKDGDILFSWSGSLEVVIWTSGKGALNQHLFKVTSKDYPKWFYYYWVLNHLIEYRHIAEGKATTMGHIQRHHLKSSLVLVPDKPILIKMDKILTKLIEKIIQINVESRNLSQIRDSLLPKLMSGKIRVPVEVK